MLKVKQKEIKSYPAIDITKSGNRNRKRNSRNSYKRYNLHSESILSRFDNG